MQHPSVTFRCLSRSDRHDLHTITVEARTALCSCVGTEWCSHIEATLLYGERHMVPFEEWDIADQAQSIMRRQLSAPAGWKAHWLDDKVWRGLAVPRKSAITRAIEAACPTICFIGEGNLGNRSDYAQEAQYLGWHVIETPTSLLTLVVCSPNAVTSKRAQSAADLDLPVISYDDWDEHAFDITELMLARIDELRVKVADLPHQLAA